MDFQQILSAISTVGFPIVCAGAMFWYMVTESRDTRKVVENNTKALMQVLEHVKKEDSQ